MYTYASAFDQERVHQALGYLHALFVTRGAGFNRTAKAATIKQSPDRVLRERAANRAMLLTHPLG